MAQPDEPSVRTSITPPWGTPFTTDQVSTEPQFTPATGSGWQVLVEQNAGTSSDFRWSVTAVGDRISASRAEARTVAEGTARRFSPNHPFNERHRSIYRVTPDEYLVVVQGMTKAFHFRVVVAELIT
jgi:sarcosine oxidase gamma subunit